MAVDICIIPKSKDERKEIKAILTNRGFKWRNAFDYDNIAIFIDFKYGDLAYLDALNENDIKKFEERHKTKCIILTIDRLRMMTKEEGIQLQTQS